MSPARTTTGTFIQRGFAGGGGAVVGDGVESEIDVVVIAEVLGEFELLLDELDAAGGDAAVDKSGDDEFARSFIGHGGGLDDEARELGTALRTLAQRSKVRGDILEQLLYDPKVNGRSGWRTTGGISFAGTSTGGR